jgi:hypothetical protein
MPRMITAHLMGGLGNQLFQIATAYAYAKENGLELALPLEWSDRPDRPSVWSTYLDISKWKNILSWEEYSQTSWQIINEAGYEFSPLPITHAPLIKLHGYFQSGLYFAAYKDELRVLLQPSLLLLAESDHFLKESGIDNVNEGWIVAHVRRGDYVTFADYHLVCGPEYYKGARAVIEAKTGIQRVCWITDDSEWVKATLRDEGRGDVVISGDATVDFTHLTQFKHMILSNSSYSWWAAWLNPRDYKDRVICCPNKWFASQGPQAFNTVYEAEWLRIDTTSGYLAEQV